MRTIIKTTIAVIAFIGITCFAQPVFAQMTFGMRDCGEWINLSKERASERSWLLGYMSGLSVMHSLNGGKEDPLARVNSAQQIYVWMDNFCQKNPLLTVSNGGTSLFIELMK